MSRLDARLFAIVALSLQVSLAAVAVAALIALPLGAAVALFRFPGRRVVIVVLNGFMGLPPVVVGLVVYLLLSRAGPLGALGLLFTPPAMVIAQALLVTPIVAALTRQSSRTRGRSTGAAALARRAPGRAVRTLLWDTRFSLLTVAARRLRPRRGRGRRGDDRRRQHRRRHAGDDHRDRARDPKGDLPLALGLGLVLVASCSRSTPPPSAAQGRGARGG